MSALDTQFATYRAAIEPFYLEVADEVAVFEAAYAERIPVLLKGPTGCGKTRFIEYMAWRLGNTVDGLDTRLQALPLVTVTCHEDLTAGDLVGRYLLSPTGTEWLDGPLARAVKEGALCYLDEIVEARKDTLVVIHALTDHRRLLPIEKLGTIVAAHPDFLLVASYNPGYQSSLKDLKHSTRQRFMAIEFDYPPEALEERIIEHEAGVEAACAAMLARLARRLRHLREDHMIEGPSTRLLIYAGRLIVRGIAPRRACEFALVQALTDEAPLQDGIRAVIESVVE
jgi:nitric oxide reductase NorQ protein